MVKSNVKKYISAMLIICVLIQLVGCYSQRTITYDEFYSLPKTEKSRVKINSGDSFELYSDSLRYNYIRWEKSKKGLTLFPSQREKL